MPGMVGAAVASGDEWARDDDGDGVREIHCCYLAVYEAMVNASVCTLTIDACIFVGPSKPEQLVR